MPTSRIHAESVARESRKRPSQEHHRRACDFWSDGREEDKKGVNSVESPGGKNFSDLRACQHCARTFAFDGLVRLLFPSLSEGGQGMLVFLWIPQFPLPLIPQPRLLREFGEYCESLDWWC